MKEFLDELEVAQIEKFCADEKMFEAVKKVLFGIMFKDGVIEPGVKPKYTNGAFNMVASAYESGTKLSNEDIGAQLRAKFEGVHTLVAGFNELKTIKSKKESVETPYNEAI